MSHPTKTLKIIGAALATLGILFTGFMAHDARYALSADVKALKHGMAKQTAEVKLIVLENRRIDLEQRVYELEATEARGMILTETQQDRLNAFRRDLIRLIERIKTLQIQADAPDE